VSAERRPRTRRGLVEPRRGWRAGAAALEFAIVAPVFLALVFGIIEFSRYAFTLISVRQAAAEAVRHASFGRSQGQAQTVARQQAPFLGDGLTVTLTCTPIPCGGGVTQINAHNVRTFTVTASFTFNFLLPFIPADVVVVSHTSQVTI
jgi:Flp pilus assembly protein TadG